jgi:hypothetical protein
VTPAETPPCVWQIRVSPDGRVTAIRDQLLFENGIPACWHSSTKLDLEEWEVADWQLVYPPSTVDQPAVTANQTREIQIKTLLDARDAARAHRRQAWDEDLGDEVARHWSATAGWLASRAKKIEAGEEPDWPDAAYSSGVDPGPHTLGCRSQTEDGGPDVCDCRTGEAT